MGPGRREKIQISQDEIDEIKRQLLESIYAEIGRSLVKKFLWAAGTVVFAAVIGLVVAGKVKLGG
jgi:hypothetical protein